MSVFSVCSGQCRALSRRTFCHATAGAAQPGLYNYFHLGVPDSGLLFTPVLLLLHVLYDQSKCLPSKRCVVPDSNVHRNVGVTHKNRKKKEKRNKNRKQNKVLNLWAYVFAFFLSQYYLATSSLHVLYLYASCQNSIL